MNFDTNKNKLFKKTNLELTKNIKGHAMFLNLSQFKDIGFFDENFFIYLEEIDLCRRLVNKGKKIYIDPNIEMAKNFVIDGLIILNVVSQKYVRKFVPA